MELFQVGDMIEWDFLEDHKSPFFAGKTYRAKVAMIDEDEKCYGVYAEYGQDLIPFENAKIPNVTHYIHR